MSELIMCLWDEAFTKNEMLEETGYCKDCCMMECSNCGKFNEVTNERDNYKDFRR